MQSVMAVCAGAAVTASAGHSMQAPGPASGSESYCPIGHSMHSEVGAVIVPS